MTSATAPSGNFAAGFCEPVGKHGLGVLGSPADWQHPIESCINVVEAEQQPPQVRPGFIAVTLRAGEDREQDGRPRTVLFAVEEQPVFTSDRL
jgi:hypothetical protein